MRRFGTKKYDDLTTWSMMYLVFPHSFQFAIDDFTTLLRHSCVMYYCLSMVTADNAKDFPDSARVTECWSDPLTLRPLVALDVPFAFDACGP
jgi:hypothetical protein